MKELADTRPTIRRHGIRPRKALGQHFLVDRSVLLKVVEAAELGPADTVIEVGPGLGVLTSELVRRAGHVIAIELDAALAARLGASLGNPPNLRVVQGDIMKLRPWEMVAPAADYKLVANLPYYIASATMRRFLGAPLPPRLTVAMAQKEVVEEIAAAPGRMRLLSVVVQYHARPEIVGYVPPSAFHPPPKVSSAIIRLRPHRAPPVAVPDPEGFFDFVAAGFRQPRKQLANSLALGLGIAPDLLQPLLGANGIESRRRPETLSLQEWAALWAAYVAGRTRRRC